MSRSLVVARSLLGAAAWAPLRRSPRLAKLVLRVNAALTPTASADVPPIAEPTPSAYFDRDGFLTKVGPETRKPRSAALVQRRDGSRQVWKTFGADHSARTREAAALVRLAEAGVAAPRLEGGTQTGLLKTFIDGPTLRDTITTRGGIIHLAQTERDSALAGQSTNEQLEAVWARGRALLTSGERDELTAALDERHLAGVTGFSLTFGNIVLESPSGRPVFIDFDGARTHASTSGVGFALARDRDRQLFNRIYGTSLLTEAGARALLAQVGQTNYAPLDLGHGLLTRGFWSIESGTGRWDYLNRRVLAPLLPGARVLDLGSHNGLMPLLMLRDGARSVVAVERDSELVEHARRLHRLFEWRAMRPLDLELRNSDMLSAIRAAEGPFDLVTAFCSLYYLSQVEMAEVVRHAARLAPTIVLQAKTDTRSGAAEGKAEKSSLECLSSLLGPAGFSEVEVHAPAGYARPILIGRRLA